MSDDSGGLLDGQFRLAVDASPCAMVLVSSEGLIAMVNPATERLFGYERDELVGQPIDVLVPEASRSVHQDNQQMGIRHDLTGVRKDGTEVPVEIGLNPVETAEGTFVLGAIVDLTERKRLERRISEQAEALEEANEQLAELAATDSLTGLWNRRAFVDQLGVQMEMALRMTRPLSVLIVDLDKFKSYNDEFGHPAGDEILTHTASILRRHARRSDYVARIGGEEFAIILPETEKAGAVTLGERFREALERATWPRREITASVGATTLEFETQELRPDPDWLSRVLYDADRALYHAKETGRNRVDHSDDIAG
jgi:diguanylate cyclase (GGDEF)-like protein/PAS domain S-box-containing protein